MMMKEREREREEEEEQESVCAQIDFRVTCLYTWRGNGGRGDDMYRLCETLRRPVLLLAGQLFVFLYCGILVMSKSSLSCHIVPERWRKNRDETRSFPSCLFMSSSA